MGCIGPRSNLRPPVQDLLQHARCVPACLCSARKISSWQSFSTLLCDSKYSQPQQVTIFNFTCELWVPRPVDDVFSFFADASNLQTITPDWLDFKILSPTPIPMRAGTLIDYKLRVHGVPVRWQTEITHWQPPHRFVDEQKRGPYRLWIHEHFFSSQNGGTLCRDHVRYSVPGGKLVNFLFVRRDVEKIFAHRSDKLKALLGKPNW